MLTLGRRQTATGRKYLRGPRGSGFLYAREGAAAAAGEPAAGDVWGARWVGRDAYEFVGDAKRYEQYETSFAAKVGLGEAIRYALDVGVDRIAVCDADVMPYTPAAHVACEDLLAAHDRVTAAAFVARHPAQLSPPGQLVLSLGDALAVRV